MRSDGAAETNCAPLIERERQLESINETLAAFKAHGSGGLVLVEGGLGTGKSSLLRAMRDRATDQGFTVLQARGSEFETDFFYGVARQIFEHWLACATPTERSALLSGPAAQATPLFDYDKGTVADPQQEQSVLHGLHYMLANLSERGPVLLLLDDLHWLDGPSARFLIRLGTRIGTHSILCCAAAAPVRRRELVAVTRAFHEAALLKRLPVSCLSQSGVREYLACAGGLGFLDPDVLRACYEATAGNPFFLHQLVDDLKRSTTADDLIDPSLIARIGPGNVARAVFRWIEHAAGRHARISSALAGALAVLGSSDSLDQLAAVAQLTRDEAEAAVGVLRDIGVVDFGTPVRYIAPVVRNAVYRQLSHTFRGRAHYSAAEILSEGSVAPERVAEHVLHGPPRKDIRVAEVLIAAGEASVRNGDFSTAITHYRRALREPVSDHALPSLLAGLGDAELRAGDPQAIDHLRRAMDVTRDPVFRAGIAFKLSSALSTVFRYREALAVLRAARGEVSGRHDAIARQLSCEIARIAELLPAMRPVVEGTGTVHGTGRFRPGPSGRTGVGGAEGVQSADALLAERALEALLNGKSAAHVARLCEQAVAHGLTVRDESGEARTPWLIAYCLFSCGRLADAGAVLDNAIQEAEALGAPLASDNLRALRAWLNRHRGMLAEAETDATAILCGGGSSGVHGLTRSFTVLTLVDLFVLRDQTDLAERVFERHGNPPEQLRQAVFLPLMVARGRMRAARGDIASGTRDILHVCRLQHEWGDGSQVCAPVTGAVHGLAALGRLDQGRRLATRHLARARAFGEPTSIAAALCAYARTVGDHLSRDALAEAAELLDGTDALVLRCSTLLQHGSALRAGGRPAQARRRLRAADEIADAVGATVLSRSARQELAALGDRSAVPSRHGGSGLAGLSPREQRVAELAAEGKRNQEIASILFVTVKTIEWHLSQVYRKLGIASRAELPKALTRG